MNQATTEPFVAEMALRLNNAAVACFHRGNVEAATELFQAALETSRKVVFQDEVQVEEQGQFGGSASREALDDQKRLLNSLVPDSPQESTHTQLRRVVSEPLGCWNQLGAQDDDSGSFLYLDPIEIDEQAISDGFVSGLTLGLICTFNLAVTLHMRDLLEDEKGPSPSNPPFQEKAARLYEISYSLLMDHEAMDYNHDSRIEKEWIISFALLNNLGILYKQLGESFKAQRAFETLLSLLMFQREQEEEPAAAAGDCESRTLDCFYSNVISELGILSEVITAASA